MKTKEKRIITIASIAVEKSIITIVSIAVFMFLLLMNSCYVVGTGEVGIPVKFGEVTGAPVPEGLHFVNPVSSLKKYNIRENLVADTTEIFTKDTQQTNIDFRFTYTLVRDKVGELYRTIGNRDALETVVIKPILLGILKDGIGQVIADELIANRENIALSVRQRLVSELLDIGVNVTGINFADINFSDAYERSVEDKVVASQRALESKNKTIQVEEEARQLILRAEAEARSMDIRAKALQQNKGLVEYEAVQKWDGKLPQYMMGNTVPFINIK